MELSWLDISAMVVGYIVILASIAWWISTYVITLKLDRERFLFKIFGFGFIYCFDKFSTVYNSLNNSRGKLNKKFFFVGRSIE